MAINSAQGGVQTTEHILLFTLVQLAVIIIAARVAGYLARRVGQPRAVGEIVAGLLLGPSLFGMVAPETFQLIFRSTDTTPISVMSQIGLIMLMFQVGLEFDFSQLKSPENKRAVGFISVLGIALPFVLGMTFGYGSAPHLAVGISVPEYALFIATAFSITTVPILGRITMAFDLTRTSDRAHHHLFGCRQRRGRLDAAGIHFGCRDGTFLGRRHVGAARFGVALRHRMPYAVRQVLRLIVRRFEFNHQALPQDLMAILLVIVFTSAMLTSKLGILAIFGGFMMGVLLHDQRELVEAWKNKVADLVTVFFLPIFFTYTGLRTDIGGLETAERWLWCPEARNIAIMMNTRALMERVVVTVGFELGVIPGQVFTMLVLMAIVSTIMTAPGVRAWPPSVGHAIPVERDA
jgi:Kef-type K+ transport system membrane component KefB